MNKKLVFFATFSLFFLFSCVDKKTEISQKDYQNAVSFMFANYNNKTAFNLNTKVNWFRDQSGIWFVDFNKKGKKYKTVAFKDGKVKDLFNQKKLAELLAESTGKSVDENQLSFTNIQRIADGLTFRFKGNNYEFNQKTDKIQQQNKPKNNRRNPMESPSPNGKWIAYTKNYNLYIRSTSTHRVFQLSHNGKRGYEYGTYYGWYDIMVGENGHPPKHFSVNWSPDSKFITTSVVDFRNAEKMYLLDSSIDSLYKPKLLSYYRGSPGDTTVVHVKPVFYNIRTKREIKTKLPRATHFSTVGTQWTNQSGILIANYVKRGFQEQFLKQVDLNSNTEKTLVHETSKTNIDTFSYIKIENEPKIIFLSECSGWRQLYQVDTNTGKITPITNGNYYVNSVKYIDVKNGVIYIMASGKEPNSNPYHQKLYKVTFDGKITLLTPENTHHVITFSFDGKYVVDAYSTINIPTKTVLRVANTGKIITELTAANVSEAEAKGWQSPEVFSLTGKDGKSPIYGAIWKPTNFNPSKKYPIIDHSYTGPHTQMFPKTFDRGFMNQSLAELGFVVVMIDGLGTSGRSKAFHNYSYKNMGKNLEDHVLAIKYLAKKHRWIDINKVGIFGHSAGGFDAGHAMLAFPDFYKVSVASSGDHDFRMEKAWWPEMYMGWPVDSTYQAVSNITQAKNLKGKLLLVHGGIDDNVNTSSTYKFAEALEKADKQFDMLILPSQRHGYQGYSQKYFLKRKWNYFVKNLAGETPIWGFKWK